MSTSAASSSLGTSLTASTLAAVLPAAGADATEPKAESLAVPDLTNSWGLLLGSDPSTEGVGTYHGPQYAYLINVANDPLILGANNTADMTILANGNVGIGSTSPAAKLDVVTGGGGHLYTSDYGCGSYGGIGGSSTLTGCTNYALLTAGTDTMINRPTGSTIAFRENNVQQKFNKPIL